ncbi:type VI secretion system contractile sheath small subunit [Cysteiniphilum litorale]|uniref:type VI secretion system contractile sheath small subunit n=1 Tax=Cysteiniphilum litorale TaxID=2056700 RepID=UPI003F8847C6
MSYKQKIPSSRVNISYDMVGVDKKKVKKNLPLKVLMLGDFSKGCSNESQKNYYDRNIISGKSGINAVMSKLNMSKTITVANHVNPSHAATLDIDLKMNKIDCFSPVVLANKIPELRRLLRLKEMISNFESLFDNNRHFQEKIRAILGSSSTKEELKSQLTCLGDYQELFKVKSK